MAATILTTMALRLNWLWRLLMTSCCFLLFGLGGWLLSLVWFNALLVIQPNEHRRRYMARRSISASFRFFLRMAQHAGVLNYHIEGAGMLSEDRGCLIVANHPTLLDYVLLASVMPNMDCLVKTTLLRNPFINGVIRAVGYLQNSQTDTLIPDIHQRLNAGDNILIFPEGTRSRPGEPLRLQRGAANIALRCGCDIRVVRINCNPATLTKHSRWFQISSQKPMFHVRVCERITNKNVMTNKHQGQALAARQLTRYLTQLLTPENG